MSSDPPTEAALRAACAELDRRIRGGEPARAEEYFDAAGLGNLNSALELIYTEYVARFDCGDCPPPDAWVARFPAWERDLRELFQIHDLLASAVEPQGDVSAPARVGRFDLVEEVGRGAGAVVYRAFDRRLDRVVAVKVLHPDGDRPDVTKLCQEGGIGARLQHPNIVPVYEIGEEGGRLFLVLEYLAGGALGERAAARPYTPSEAARLVAIVARATHYAHLMGVVHRDLKPANILLTPDGVPKVADFGLARFGRADSGGAVVGTAGYMAPEQRDGRPVGPAADVYALGMILRNLLAGQRSGRDLNAVVARCVREEPTQRYADAAALANDLDRYAAGEPVKARPVWPLERGWKFARRSPATAGLIGLCLAAVTAGVALGVRYNVRLRVAVDRAEDQSRLYRDQLAETRRTAYALQMSHVDMIRMTDPVRGRTLLDDPRVCPPELREFAWRYLRRLCERDRRTIVAGGPVYGVEVSAKGDVAAVVREPGGDSVAAWDLATGSERWRVRVSGRVAALTFSTDGGRLTVVREPRPEAPVVATDLDATDGAAVGPARHLNGLFLAQTMTPAGVVSASQVEEDVVVSPPGGDPARYSLPRGLKRAALSDDGRRVAVWDYECRVTVWDADGRRLASVKMADRVRLVSFAPGAKVVAVVSGRTVWVCDAETLIVRATLTGHTNDILAAAFSPDGDTLVTGGEDFTVRLWDAVRGTALETLRGHGHGVTAVAYTPDGQSFVTGSSDGSLRVWDAQPERRLVLPHTASGKVLAAAVTPDGATLATGGTDGAVALWDPTTGRRTATIAAHPRFTWALAFSPDGRTLATGAPDEPVKLWDTATGRSLRELSCHVPDPVTGERSADQGPNALAIEFLPGTSRVVTAHQDGRLRVWESTRGVAVREFPAHPGAASALALAPNRRLLASGGADGRVRLWDPETWDARGEFTGHDGRVVSLAFDPAGERLASTGTDHLVKLWSLADDSVRTLRGHTHWPYSVAFAQDGRTLVTGTADRMSNVVGEVKLWDPESGRALLTIPGQGGPVRFVTGGRGLATADLKGRAYVVHP